MSLFLKWRRESYSCGISPSFIRRSREDFRDNVYHQRKTSHYGLIDITVVHTQMEFVWETMLRSRIEIVIPPFLPYSTARRKGENARAVSPQFCLVQRALHKVYSFVVSSDCYWRSSISLSRAASTFHTDTSIFLLETTPYLREKERRGREEWDISGIADPNEFVWVSWPR